MAQRQHKDDRTALPLVLPFILVYGALFLYPTLQMIAMSFTDAQLIVPGHFVGLDNYFMLLRDWRVSRSVANTAWFVALTVVPSTVLGLALAVLVNRMKGRWQGFVLALFFLPYILPVSTVTGIWSFLFNTGTGVLQYPIMLFLGHRLPVFRTIEWVLPVAAVITVWWTIGFNILLFLAGLKAIPHELYEAAAIDDANRWHQFRHITWPLIWPVTALVLTIQLITQIKIFDQVYLLVQGGRVDSTLVLVQYIYTLAFQRNQGGYAATVAVMLFVIVLAVATLQFQILRARGAR